MPTLNTGLVNQVRPLSKQRINRCFNSLGRVLSQGGFVCFLVWKFSVFVFSFEICYNKHIVNVAVKVCKKAIAILHITFENVSIFKFPDGKNNVDKSF